MFAWWKKFSETNTEQLPWNKQHSTCNDLYKQIFTQIVLCKSVKYRQERFDLALPRVLWAKRVSKLFESSFERFLSVL